MTLQAIWHVFKVNLLHLIKLVHCCELVKQLLLGNSERSPIEGNSVAVHQEIERTTIRSARQLLKTCENTSLLS